MRRQYSIKRRFPGITDSERARECARTIAGWQPLSALPLRPVKRLPKVPRLRRVP